MISDLALYICLNMVTCYLMFECFVYMRQRKSNVIDYIVTTTVFGLGALMLGYYGSQWVMINLGG